MLSLVKGYVIFTFFLIFFGPQTVPISLTRAVASAVHFSTAVTIQPQGRSLLHGYHSNSYHDNNNRSSTVAATSHYCRKKQTKTNRKLSRSHYIPWSLNNPASSILELCFPKSSQPLTTCAHRMLSPGIQGV